MVGTRVARGCGLVGVEVFALRVGSCWRRGCCWRWRDCGVALVDGRLNGEVHGKWGQAQQLDGAKSDAGKRAWSVLVEFSSGRPGSSWSMTRILVLSMSSWGPFGSSAAMKGSSGFNIRT